MFKFQAWQFEKIMKNWYKIYLDEWKSKKGFRLSWIRFGMTCKNRNENFLSDKIQYEKTKIVKANCEVIIFMRIECKVNLGWICLYPREEILTRCELNPGCELKTEKKIYIQNKTVRILSCRMIF